MMAVCILVPCWCGHLQYICSGGAFFSRHTHLQFKLELAKQLIGSIVEEKDMPVKRGRPHLLTMLYIPPKLTWSSGGETGRVQRSMYLLLTTWLPKYVWTHSWDWYGCDCCGVHLCSFIDQGKFEARRPWVIVKLHAVMSISFVLNSRCLLELFSTYCHLTRWSEQEWEIWHFCNRTLFCLAVFK